jgi:hypothetical protein
MTSRGELITCPICGKTQKKTRPWSVYCSGRCRKAAYSLRKKDETPADIRATLARIESKIDQLLLQGEKAHA